MTKRLIILFFSLPLFSSAWVQATPFDQGVVNVSVLVGSGRAYNDNYTVLGAGIGYYVTNGLLLGLDYEYWSGGDPTIQQLSPRINYVFARNKSFSPYAGVFYRRTKIDTLPDSDAYGARAGAYARSGRNFIMGFGVAYIEYKDCEESIFQTCSDTYPEFTLGFYY
jgi:hypothetical protein